MGTRRRAPALNDALEQIELADRLGIDYVWEVEHHFLEEYSHSSAPEVFLGAVSQRTERIRLGHGIVQLPPNFNHPARIAERIATLDLLSDGRVEFGTGEASSEVELGGFGDRPRARSATSGPRPSTRSRACSSRSRSPATTARYVKMPPRNVVPEAAAEAAPAALGRVLAPRDDPPGGDEGHRRAVVLVHRAGRRRRRGSTTTTRRSRPSECVPAGFAVNPNVAIVPPFMCHRDEETAIERGLDGGHFFGYSLGHYYVFGDHQPGRTAVWDEFQRNRALFGFDRDVAAQTEVEPRRAAVPAGARLGARRDRNARADPRVRPRLRARPASIR